MGHRQPRQHGGANRAQAALVFSPTPVAAMPDKLTACAGDDALAVLAAMGLTQVEIEVGVEVEEDVVVYE